MKIPIEEIIEQIKQGIKPKCMSNTLFKYVQRTEKLDTVLEKLTRDYCPSVCKISTGCCNIQGYRYGVPNSFSQFQEAEALYNLWESPGEGCKYISKEGCKLTLFKAPICITGLCQEIKQHLRQEYGRQGEKFYNLMWDAVKYNLKHKPSRLFRAMDAAIAQGEKLIEKRKKLK